MARKGFLYVMKKRNLMLANVAVMAMPLVTFAEGEEFAGKLLTLANTIQQTATKIVLPILAILIVIFGFRILMGGDAKTMEEAKRNLIRCIIGGLIVLFAPTILNILANLLGSGDSQFTINGITAQ